LLLLAAGHERRCGGNCSGALHIERTSRLGYKEHGQRRDEEDG